VESCCARDNMCGEQETHVKLMRQKTVSTQKGNSQKQRSISSGKEWGEMEGKSRARGARSSLTKKR